MAVKDQTDELDLGDLIHEEAFNDPRCFDSQRYAEWESDVAEPILRAAGFTVLRWYSTDEDSFGPLVRAVDIEREGQRQTYVYG